MTIRVEFRDEENLPVHTADMPCVPARGDHVRVIAGVGPRSVGPVCEVTDVRWEMGDMQFVVVTVRAPGRLARVLMFPELDSRLAAGRLVNRGRVWSSRRTGGKR